MRRRKSPMSGRSCGVPAASGNCRPFSRPDCTETDLTKGVALARRLFVWSVVSGIDRSIVC
jgi:hypothetical protein